MRNRGYSSCRVRLVIDFAGGQWFKSPTYAETIWQDSESYKLSINRNITIEAG